MIHSHPLCQPGAVQAEEVLQQMQQLLQQAGYLAVGLQLLQSAPSDHQLAVEGAAGPAEPYCAAQCRPLQLP